MEKYSFSAKKLRTINENRETIGLNNVAKQKTPYIPHHVFTFIVSPVKSLLGCFFLTIIKIACADSNEKNIKVSVHIVLSRKAPPYHD